MPRRPDAELWAQLPAGAEGVAQEAWCGGCVRLGRAAVPFSVRLLPGALRLAPDRLEWVPPPLSFYNLTISLTNIT